MNILEQIVEHKKIEVAKRKKEVPVSELKMRDYFNRATISLKQSLNDSRTNGIIAEFKRRSPSKGVINANANVIEITEAYTRIGATALSVLTDEAFFGGSDADLLSSRKNAVPILRKDFIVDDYQLIEAKSIGADAILLIAACLSPVQVRQLALFAKDLGLEVLLELHDENELAHICDAVDLVGINNRNLKTFEVNIQQSLKMAEKIPNDKTKIAESGINSIDDIVLFKESGFKGFLIGELFMREEDPAIAFAEFVNALQLIPPHSEGF